MYCALLRHTINELLFYYLDFNRNLVTWIFIGKQHETCTVQETYNTVCWFLPAKNFGKSFGYKQVTYKQLMCGNIKSVVRIIELTLQTNMVKHQGTHININYNIPCRHNIWVQNVWSHEVSENSDTKWQWPLEMFQIIWHCHLQRLRMYEINC